MDPLAADLVAHGWAAANLEYRRVGEGGGWPATFDDVRNGIDALRDTGPIVTVGHSAGGHLALWASGHVDIDGAVSLAGVVDLQAAARLRLSNGAVQELLGGEPDEVPERYSNAAPEPRVPHLVVHGTADDTVPVAFAEAWDVPLGDVRILDGADHMSVIDPATPAWAAVRDWLTRWT
jgi:acetyl esterase/lipase